MKTATIFVSGDIQEVGYRTRIQGIAQYLQVDGCIKNLPDGRVKIVVQGTPEKAEDFVSKINVKDELIFVDEVKVNYSNSFEKFNGFNKIVGSNETDSRLDKAVNELKNVVTVLKETNTSIKELRDEVKNGNQEIIKEIRGLKEYNNESIRHEVREVASDLQEVKTLLKMHLKQS